MHLRLPVGELYKRCCSQLPSLPIFLQQSSSQSFPFVTNMPVNFKEITTEAEFSRVIDCMWPAYSNPYIPFLQILFPVFSPTAEGYQAAVDGSKIGMWTTHSSDPSSHWVAVVDSDTGEVFAGAHWNFHKVSPFLNGAPTLIAMWHPEGESREFASRMLNQVYGGRGSKMWRPYARKSFIFRDFAW